MHERTIHGGLNLHSATGGRKYLNAVERRRFIKAALRAPPEARLFCLVLGYTGARISEVLALTAAAIDIDSGTVSIRTLKRRKPGIERQVAVAARCAARPGPRIRASPSAA